jgi:hypothetical protein
LPAPYRIDYSIVLDLERQLSLHDRDLAISLAEEAAKTLATDQPVTQWSRPDQSAIVTTQASFPHAVGGNPEANQRDSPMVSLGARQKHSGMTAEQLPAIINQQSAIESLSSAIQLIEQALLANTPLTLAYRSPTYGDSLRTVDPLRLEWHGDVPYLIAYCRLRQDERTFRVDRILDIRE